jgi:hypothetical protein
MTPAPTDLMPCPFKRGQVWENPDGLMMIVTSVREYGETYKVEYISEDGELGKFYGNDKAITDNCELMSDLVPRQAVTVDVPWLELRIGEAMESWDKDTCEPFQSYLAKHIAQAAPAVPAEPTDKDAMEASYNRQFIKVFGLETLLSNWLAGNINPNDKSDALQDFEDAMRSLRVKGVNLITVQTEETIRRALSAPAREAMLVELIRWQYENGPSVHIMPDCVQPNILKIREIIRDSK